MEKIEIGDKVEFKGEKAEVILKTTGKFYGPCYVLLFPDGHEVIGVPHLALKKL